MNVRKLTTMGILAGLSVALVIFIHFPIFPAVSFLEYDPADIPILIGAFAFGPAAGFCIAVVAAVIQGLTVSAQSGLYGILMHILSTGCYVLVAGLLYKRNKTRKGAVVSLVFGMLASAVVMIFSNLLITPAYLSTLNALAWADNFAIVKSLLPFIVLFNFIKPCINGLAVFFIYKPISNFLRSSTRARAPKTNTH